MRTIIASELEANKKEYLLENQKKTSIREGLPKGNRSHGLW